MLRKMHSFFLNIFENTIDVSALFKKQFYFKGDKYPFSGDWRHECPALREEDSQKTELKT
jgi:hypothetical protein